VQPRKNLARLITAYERLCARQEIAWDLVLAGGAGWLSAPILAQARQSRYAERIHLPGYVPDADLPALLAGAYFFCFPSLYEGFGLPVLEAQQLGVPVITSNHSAANNSALPEIAGEAALLVDPTDVEAIAQAMLTLSQDEALRQRLIEAGYANVQRFSWEKAAAETLAVLVAAVEGASRASGYEPDLRE
jgi:glycosyltransferase involved in cell wall biosynthesis